MKLFKNKAFAIFVLIAAIALSSLYGISKAPEIRLPEGSVPLDESLSTYTFGQYVEDRAGVLSKKTMKAVCLYNANWDRMAGSILAVVTLGDKEETGSAEDLAWDWAETLQLGENDAILVINATNQDYSVVASGRFFDLLDAQSASFVDTLLEESIHKRDYDQAVLNLFGGLHQLFGMYQTDSYAGGAGMEVFRSVLSVVVLLVVLVLLFNCLDGIRYNSWSARYGGMAVPPVVYRPIFWWHRPGSALSVTISGTAITAFAYRCRLYTAEEDLSPLLPAGMARAIASLHPGAGLSLGYVDGVTGQISAQWLAR